MRLKAICKRCDHILNFEVEQERNTCPYCSAHLTIKDVRMSSLEYNKYVTFMKSQREAAIGREKKAEQAVKAKVPEAEERRERPVATLRLVEAKREPAADEDQAGKYLIMKGKTRYGNLEITNPDYMILKLNFWTMGDQQKQFTQQLGSVIKRFLAEMGFELKKVK